jgi:hypothetical protein
MLFHNSIQALFDIDVIVWFSPEGFASTARNARSGG